MLGPAALATLSLVLGAQSAAAQEPQPLPDPAAVLREVITNLDKVQAGREDYTATKTVVDSELDGQGRVKKTHERAYYVFFVGGKVVEKLVAENGRPLAEARAKKEEARVEKQVAENRAELAKRAGQREKEKAEEDGEASAARILRLCRFVNGRRETFRDRAVLVYEFEPRPEVKARGRVESWIQKVTGQVRVDEESRHLVRLEARTTSPLRIGGGLFLSVGKGSTLVLEQDLVKGEMWLPTYAEVHASARFLLLKGFKTNRTETFSDYRKFAVDTTSEIKPPY
jgi:hypothetical protein